MTSLDLFCQENLKKITAAGKLRQLKNDEQQELISFASNDYFGLSKHPKVLEAAQLALSTSGFGERSARLVSGNNHYHQKLEAELANYKNTEAALVFGSGYLASFGVVAALMSKSDLIIADKFAHACLLDGARLSGAKLLRFKHLDYQHLAELLIKERANYQNCLIITETVFSMDGDKTDFEQIFALAKKHQAWVLSDDAHGIGLAKMPENFADHIQLGTMSKGLGCYGGYICASQKLIALMQNQARSFIYTTALPSPIIAAARQALALLKDDLSISKKLQNNIKFFSQKSGLANHGTPIFKKEFSTISDMQKAAEKLLEAGFLVGAIRPPTAPTPRLRISISAAHTVDQLEGLVSLTS